MDFPGRADRWRISVTALALAVPLGWSLLWASGALVSRAFISPVVQQMRADYARYWPLAMEDMRTFGRIAGPPMTPGADAGEFLQSRVRWESARSRGHPETGGPLALPPALLAQLRNAGDQWVALEPGISRGVDLSWLKELERYQSWNVWKRLFEVQAQPINPIDTAFPDFAPFQQWTKLRLLRGSLDGDAATASAEVRHLASLLFSTSDLLGVAVSLSLLNLEARFLKSRGLPSDAAALEAGGSFMAAAFGPHLLLEPAELERALDDAAAGPFRCLSMAQVAWTSLPFKNGLARRRRAQLELIERRLARDASPCRLQALQRAWNGENGARVGDFIDAIESAAGRRAWRVLSWVPITGSLVFELGAALTIPAGYRRYSAKAAATTDRPEKKP